MLSKEQILAAFAVNVSSADGSIEESEIKKITNVGIVKKLNLDALTKAIKKEIDSPSDLTEIVMHMTDEDQQFALFGVLSTALADGKIASKEVLKIHSICDLFGFGQQPHFATMLLLRQLKKDPSLQVEGVDF